LVNECCAELVGLSSRQFERVALLPQGEFMQESRSDRTKLLRTLFSSEVFEQATQLLIERARKAQQNDAAELAATATQLTKLADELSNACQRPVTDDPSAITGALESYATTVLAPLRAQLVTNQDRADAAARSLRQAQDGHDRAQRRTQIQTRLVTHLETKPTYDALVAEVERARSAVPVVQAADRSDSHFAQRGEVEQSCVELEAAVRAAASACGLTLADTFDDVDLRELSTQLAAVAAQQRADDELRDQIGEISEQLLDLNNQRRATVSTTDTLNRRRQQIVLKRASVDEQIGDGAAPDLVALERDVASYADHADKRRQLDRVQTRLAELEPKRVELEQRVQAAHAELLVARRAVERHADLFAASQAAVTALEQCEQTVQHARLLRQATASLPALRAKAKQAEQHAEHVWQGYLQSTAPRLAASLTDDSPCPVCGSCEHPAPATSASTDQLVDHTEVAQARQLAEAERDQLTSLQQRIAELVEANPHASQTNLDDLQTELDAAKQAAFHARSEADANHQSARAATELEATVTKAQTALQSLLDTEKSDEQQANQLLGSLGTAATSSLDDLESQATRAQHALSSAQRRTAALQQLQERAADLAVANEDLDLEVLHAEGELSRIEALLANAHERRNELNVKLTAPSTDAAVAIPANAIQLVSDLETQLGVRAQIVETLRRSELLVDQRLNESPFASLDHARTAARTTAQIARIDHDVADWARIHDQLRGQLQEIGELPKQPGSLAEFQLAATTAAAERDETQRRLVRADTLADRWAAELAAIQQRRAELALGDPEGHALARVAALVKGDNDRNTSLENWVLAAHLRDVVAQANLRLGRSTQQRFQLCVLDDGETRKGTWGLDLGVEDTVTGTRRPTEGLSGGELFQASLALALGLADVVMADSAGVRIDALFIDEGFGSLDQNSVERAIDLLDELRGRGAMVGVITHVPALLEALPRGVTVTPRADGMGSRLHVQSHAA